MYTMHVDFRQYIIILPSSTFWPPFLSELLSINFSSNSSCSWLSCLKSCRRCCCFNSMQWPENRKNSTQWKCIYSIGNVQTKCISSYSISILVVFPLQKCTFLRDLLHSPCSVLRPLTEFDWGCRRLWDLWQPSSCSLLTLADSTLMMLHLKWTEYICKHSGLKSRGEKKYLPFWKFFERNRPV